MKEYMCADIRFVMTHVPNDLKKKKNNPVFCCFCLLISISVLRFSFLVAKYQQLVCPSISSSWLSNYEEVTTTCRNQIA